MRFFPALAILCFSSLYVIILDSIAFSSRSLQQAIVLLVITIFSILYKYSRHSWKEFTNTEGKFFFISSGTAFVQLLVLSTGGLQSPFLILIHLFMLGLSFLFSFSVSFLFLLFSLIVIFIDLSFSQHFLTLLANDPSLLLLQLASLIVIIPIAYITSRQYHMKDTLTKLLQTQIKTTKKILERLPELIIITDDKLRILSTNDAATHALQRSRSELLDKPLFDVLLLKDQSGKLVTEQSLFPQGKIVTQPETQGIFTLFKSSIPKRAVTLQVQPNAQKNGETDQISFILSFVHSSEHLQEVTLDKARARYDAILQRIKQIQPQSSKTDILLLEKIENDTYALQTLTENAESAKIDLAQLCKQIVLFNQDFSRSMNVVTDFSLPNFGQQDIAPLTVANYPVKPEQLTGPFFTISCDVQKVELAIKKLLDMCILLASTEKAPQVKLSVQREEKETVSVNFRGTCKQLTTNNLTDLFTAYYDSLAKQTNLDLGSGLEGYLVKRIADMLSLPLSISYEKQTAEIVFTLKLPKKLRS